MFLNKIDLPYCLVVFFVVCPRLRPFWSVFGELALFWCSTAKRKEKDKAEQWFPECPSLEANNSAGKLPPASIPLGIQGRDFAVSCSFTRFAIPPTDHSLAMLLSLARSASEFRSGLFQTAVDPFTDRIVCRVTKISPARVASGLQSTNKQTPYRGTQRQFSDNICWEDDWRTFIVKFLACLPLLRFSNI